MDSYRTYLKSYKSTTRLDARPTIVYGMQQHLKNCGSLYICCHGLEEGSALVMDIVGTEFTDVKNSFAIEFEENFFYYLGQGKSVYASIGEAKKDLRDKKENKNEHEKIINAVERFGNLGLIIE